MFSALDTAHARLAALRPLPPAVVRNLHEDLVLRWTYHSNAIEGNTLTLQETKVVLEGITIGGKLLREHFEAINHREAIGYVEALAQSPAPLTEYHIRALHQLVLKNIDDENAGRYRTTNILLTGATHTPPEAIHVPGLMADFAHWLATTAPTLHPVERAARVHVDFVKIHPFVGSNGRTARLLMNLELLKAAYPALIIPVEQRLAYYQTLDAAHVRGDYAPFLALLAACLEQSFARYWQVLGVSPVN